MPRRKKQDGINDDSIINPTIEDTSACDADPRRSSQRIIAMIETQSPTSTSHKSKAAASQTKRLKGLKMASKSSDVTPQNRGDDMSSEAESNSTSELYPDGVNDQRAKGVGSAIQRLSRLERRLQRNLKKQQLKVEKSVDSLDAGAHRSAAKKPHPSRCIGDINTPPPPAPEKKYELIDLDVPRVLTAKRDLSIDKNSIPKKSGQKESKVVESVDQTPGEAERGAARPPPVDSDYLPLPWTGRLGYACLNTYLRAAKPAVFSSRTCRMSSIIDHRHPLTDPTQPEHANKNRPDKSQKPERQRGQEFIQKLGLANARDIDKMLRWNERYGIRFMRLSSEMFPFASHEEHGYKLAPFASEVLADAGKTAAKYGHRLTTHPGQFTQLGSPRAEVITASVRDLEYHDEMLTLLKLPEQQDRDAVMILHMGGVYGDKAATLDRFRHNYTTLLSDSIKRRLVLENDDVSWSVHDLLPICEELNIPLVLDFHHHNIVFDPEKVREGTADIVPLFPRIRATWDRKNIRVKMHYSEPCSGAVTPRDRRKHSPRVATLPPCPPDTDLMIEAKDKEQAVFELMRNFKLPGYERIRSIIPNERADEPRPPPSASKISKGKNGRPGKKKKKEGDDDYDVKAELGDDITHHQKDVPEGLGYDDPTIPPAIPLEEINMGGPDGRVYWPPGMEDWLRPLKRDQKRKIEDVEEHDE
ncbi:hypothetical protein MCOR25_008635 [Pyricularia grisea]|uniref:UV-damage endonuclease n=1 Tax=Pyricularia grisea TaxID=148305 RepID=A0A6P8BM01_PYRGI|nr:uncharacterized protein PgNI_01500 [Pyricularia grisea]KAI6354376.1 hypothetical protein MCOR25_008635 [Pyricularia grisea]TLD17665.1 hypothetical protein PgNI_01500 [Pyricularia grisea]